MRQRFVCTVRASSRSLALMFVGMLALGIGIGSSFGIAGVVAGPNDPNKLHACVSKITGAMRYVTDPAQCTNYERVVSWDSSAADGLSFEVRTAIKEVPANAGGQASNSVYCEPGETAISGGSRVLYEGVPTFASWVKFNLGGGPLGTPANGWVEGYSFANTLPDTFVETWAVCVS